ncbi:hypothetical protein LCGC14_1843760 [marine sediment metagenome]|uniref:DNA methylase N-4/N-6 domain-containing protein n=1 Tax=marine sediment metagenome TaxID=412755 RepID=A0A0F9GCE2_9ZZZZ
MKPYYQDDAVTIYLGDCREVLPLLGPVDLVLTDPPYGVRWQSNHRAQKFAEIEGDTGTDAAVEAIALALPLLRTYRHIYVFGRYDFGGLPVTAPVELIWDKGTPSGGDTASPWGKAHEYIQFMSYVPSKANVRKGYGKLSARLRKGSVISVHRITGAAVTRHPTEKPVLLLRQMIESSSLIGDTVLDPFAGVGSTLVAAVVEGRKAIGIEIEERYCEIAAQRMSQAVLPL